MGEPAKAPALPDTLREAVRTTRSVRGVLLLRLRRAVRDTIEDGEELDVRIDPLEVVEVVEGYARELRDAVRR